MNASHRRRWPVRVSSTSHSASRDAAEVIEACARILTNTNGRPLYSDIDGQPTPSVLASYGLYVNTSGLLESPANAMRRRGSGIL